MSEPPHPEVAILNAALELPVEQRVAYLDQACAGDANLRQQIEALLQAHGQAGAFLAAPPAGFDFNRTEIVNVPLSEKPGDKIGHYKLLQQIGEGGCGVVYMAEQEEPVHRRVALKVIKLGMDTKQVIARFEAERQALALMDHPNIAKVFDAGATDAGRPFFVMELVRGIKITDYCDENKVSTEERLKLFIQVCQAIQHAHQKGIIHRDIKPSNILVTVSEPGAPGSPKVIDFGIAKATTGQRLTDKTVFTAFEQFIGTPAYMSPEQAMMTALDIDTRTDIYALGVLLYELLTGQTPFDAKDLIAVGLDAMRRIIREEEPVRPSTRLKTMLPIDLTTVARHRQAEPAKLGTLLRGDLDWIVMKALEKDRARRYETANGLARDIQRHLENEPVVARPPSKFYRFQKMVRRNKGVFAAAGAVAAALVIGLAISTWLLLEERAARQRAVAAEKQAQTEAAKSQQVAQFLRAMLTSAGPEVALGRDTTLLRGILDRTTERIGRDLKDLPKVEGELLTVCGGTYEAIGEKVKAEAAYRRALVLQRRVLGKDDPTLADTLFGLAQVLTYDRPEESETYYRESLEIRRKLYGSEHWIVAASLNNITAPLVMQGKFAEAEAFSREALAMKRKLLAKDHPEVSISLRDLGLVLRSEGKLPEAESSLREGLAAFRRTFGDAHPDVPFTLNGLADVLSKEGKLAEAEAADREALAIQRKLYHSKSAYLANTLHDLADILQREGKLAEAQALLQERTNPPAEPKREPR